MSSQIPGVIHGKTIELRDDPGLGDGQEVVVTLQPTSNDPKINPKTGRPWGEGIRASAGAFADWPEADKFIDEIMRARKADTGREIPE